MTDSSPQLEMLGSRPPEVSVELQDELARGCRDRHHALVKCYEVSNLTGKQVYGPLGLDQATFSRFLSGKANLPHNSKFPYMDLCGNEIPLRYDNFMRGYEMRPVQTSVEAENTRLREQLAEQERLIKALGEMLRGSR